MLTQNPGRRLTYNLRAVPNAVLSIAQDTAYYLVLDECQALPIVAMERFKEDAIDNDEMKT